MTERRTGRPALWNTEPVREEAIGPTEGAGARVSVPHAHDARVVLYSRAGCHLCAQARDEVAAACAEVGADWLEVDIDADTPQRHELRELFTERVPVTFVDGSQHAFWRVDPRRLRRALTAG